jgi:hypothetical protein
MLLAWPYIATVKYALSRRCLDIVSIKSDPQTESFCLLAIFELYILNIYIRSFLLKSPLSLARMVSVRERWLRGECVPVKSAT